jgi:hypothetical protein
MQSKSVMHGTAQTNFFKLLTLNQRNRKVVHLHKKQNFVTGELQSENKLNVDYAYE